MIKPFEDKVLLRPVEEVERISESGLVLAGMDNENPSEAIVEAVGPGLTFPDGTRLDIKLSPGDKVVYSKFAAVEYNEYLLIPYKDILVVIEDE